ncbi:hypothetical protein WEI85_09970 [Actinomycetes bacterium KLBMP 9797]
MEGELDAMVGGMAAPLARTHEEAHLYMELHPCPACGEPEFDAASAVRETDAGWLVRYAGVCVQCGRARAFEFRQPDEMRPPAEGAWASGAEPSELLDAGEWLFVADTYASAPAGADSGASIVDLRSAAAALDEVLKFLPDGAAALPDEAFWSARGRAVRAAEPGRFSRVRLLAARATYARLLASAHDQGVPVVARTT